MLLLNGGRYHVEIAADTTVSTTRYYSIAGQRPAMRNNDGSISYLLGDHLGSVSTVVDANGEIISQSRYLPFGELLWEDGASPTDYTYTGQRSLSDIGLMDYNARFYDPMLGRFTSPDSIVPDMGSVIGYNRFAYVNNNPIRYNDPSGHVTCNVISNNYQGDCQTDINTLLVILEEQGGDLGKELAQGFRENDIYHFSYYEDEITITDTITINIVDKTVQGGMMEYDGDNWAYNITVGAIASTKNSNFGAQVIAGAFAHEITHQMQGPLIQPSLKAEVGAYYNQYSIYQNMGIADRAWEADENGNLKNPTIASAQIVASYNTSSNYDIIHSNWANEHYNSYPLYKIFGKTGGLDSVVRFFVDITHTENNKTNKDNSIRRRLEKVK